MGWRALGSLSIFLPGQPTVLVGRVGLESPGILVSFFGLGSQYSFGKGRVWAGEPWDPYDFFFGWRTHAVLVREGFGLESPWILIDFLGPESPYTFGKGVDWAGETMNSSRFFWSLDGP